LSSKADKTSQKDTANLFESLNQSGKQQNARTQEQISLEQSLHKNKSYRLKKADVTAVLLGQHI